jgi:Transposase DDE domain
VGSSQTRRRKLTPENFFQAMVQLAGGTNNEGYQHALMNTFLINQNGSTAPVKSALAKQRRRVKSDFFKEIFHELLADYDPHRWTYNGLRIYAIDGNEKTIPASEDILENGYRGRAMGGGKETYYPHLYEVQAYDVLSGVTKDIFVSPHRNELLGMEAIVPRLEKNSLCLYDRFYFGTDLLKLHEKSGNYFLARVPRNSFLEVRSFWYGKAKQKTVLIRGVKVTLFKVRNARNKTIQVFATNLSRRKINRRNVARLYQMRWQIETSFYDGTCTLRIKQWHSRFFDGILQELFCAYWLLNFTRIQIAVLSSKPKDLMALEYRRPNLKLLFNWTVLRWTSISDPSVHEQLLFLIKYGSENRKHLSRSNQRRLRSGKGKFERQRDSVVKRRPVK